MSRASIMTNWLASETSPYLLQHAQNPVAWYPWGEEALRRADTERKPIFLSIGYSSCHWCHVMARESFADMATAAILNEHFIAIKVDREERPDLDDIYMAAVQILTGRGGWPLNVFLTPDWKPFFGGTYFPPEDRLGMPGFKSLLLRVAALWRDRPSDVAAQADNIVEALAAHTTFQSAPTRPFDRSIVTDAIAVLRDDFDPQWGGFGGAPKFPPSSAIALLLRQYQCAGDVSSLNMATVTLDRMAQGGIHDHLGGGFHRYAVDTKWLVPHFEKMLYDNALLSQVYLEAWQVTGRDRYRQVAAGIFDYVLRDLTDPRGGFYAAEDADSDGEEGKFYVWRPDEIEAELGVKAAQLFCQYYGVTKAGNFAGANILNRLHTVDPGANHEEKQEVPWPDWQARLLARRNRRVRPARDTKVLAAWNGMMISALALGYQVLGRDHYRMAAERAADFVLSDMVQDGVLLRSYRTVLAEPERDSNAVRGVAKWPGYLDDYAEFAFGLVALYQATGTGRWLDAANRLARRMIADFWDAENGGFFYTSAAHRQLLARLKPAYDGAVPSGNAAAVRFLFRLAQYVEDSTYTERGYGVVACLHDSMRSYPRAHLDLLRTLVDGDHSGSKNLSTGSREIPGA